MLHGVSDFRTQAVDSIYFHVSFVSHLDTLAGEAEFSRLDLLDLYGHTHPD